MGLISIQMTSFEIHQKNAKNVIINNKFQINYIRIILIIFVIFS